MRGVGVARGSFVKRRSERGRFDWSGWCEGRRIWGRKWEDSILSSLVAFVAVFLNPKYQNSNLEGNFYASLLSASFPTPEDLYVLVRACTNVCSGVRNHHHLWSETSFSGSASSGSRFDFVRVLTLAFVRQLGRVVQGVCITLPLHPVRAPSPSPHLTRRDRAIRRIGAVAVHFAPVWVRRVTFAGTCACTGITGNITREDVIGSDAVNAFFLFLSGVFDPNRPPLLAPSPLLHPPLLRLPDLDIRYYLCGRRITKELAGPGQSPHPLLIRFFIFLSHPKIFPRMRFIPSSHPLICRLFFSRSISKIMCRRKGWVAGKNGVVCLLVYSLVCAPPTPSKHPHPSNTKCRIKNVKKKEQNLPGSFLCPGERG